MAAAARRDMDERQAYRRLKVQALVGKVTSLAAAVAYLVAFGVRAPLWPFAIAVAIPVLATLAGWAIYREHGEPRRLRH